MPDSPSNTEIPGSPDASDQKDPTSFFVSRLTSRQFLTRRVLPAALTIAIALLVVPPLSRALAQVDAQKGSKPSAPAAAIPVRVAPAMQVESYSVRTPYTGTLVARRRSEIGFERQGKLVRLLADEGDIVSIGQPLAELDQRRLKAGVRRVEAELAQAVAVLAELDSGPREQTIAAAKAELRSKKAQRAAAARHLARRRELVETRAISQEEFDESRFQDERADAVMEVAQRQLDELQAGTRVEKISAQKARVAGLEASLAYIKHELEDTTLLAPFGGTVARRRLDEGSIVAAGTPVFDLVEQDYLEAWVGVPASVAQRLTLGDSATIVVGNQEYSSRIRSFRPELNPATRTRNIVFAIEGEEASQKLVAGQVARVLINESVAEQGYWIPTVALTPRNRGLWAAYVVEKDSVQARDVQLVHTEGDRSFVSGTLSPGEQVVVSGAHKVVVGQKVTPIPIEN